MTNLDDFLRGYAEAMLWANAVDAETGEQVEDMEYAYITPGQWWEDSPVELADASIFYVENLDDLKATKVRDFAQHGHDFALTRNGHGAGFWDRGYGEIGQRLTEAAHVYGEALVYITSEDD